MHEYYHSEERQLTPSQAQQPGQQFELPFGQQFGPLFGQLPDSNLVRLSEVREFQWGRLRSAAFIYATANTSTGCICSRPGSNKTLHL